MEPPTDDNNGATSTNVPSCPASTPLPSFTRHPVKKVVNNNAGSVLVLQTPRDTLGSSVSTASTLYGEKLRRACARSEMDMIKVSMYRVMRLASPLHSCLPFVPFVLYRNSFLVVLILIMAMVEVRIVYIMLHSLTR